MDRSDRLRRRMAAVVIALASPAAMTGVAVPAPQEPGDTPYRITDGKVDKRTFNGFRRYNSVCNHCHGLDGAGGSFGQSLVEQPMAIEEFRDAVLAGRTRGSFVMKGYAGDPNVAPFVDDIYAYLRARADGVLGRGRPAVAD